MLLKKVWNNQISDPPPAGAGGFLLYYLDIGIKFWNVRKCFSRIFLYTFYEDFSPISRYPDVMIFCFIDSMGTLATSYTLSYQILTRLDSHYITRQESGVLCGSIKITGSNITIGHNLAHFFFASLGYSLSSHSGQILWLNSAFVLSLMERSICFQ